MNTVAVNGTKEYEKEVVSRKDSLTERFFRYLVRMQGPLRWECCL